MRVLLVPDRCGELTSVEVAGLLRDGWMQANPAVELETLPLGSGDDGFVAALAGPVGGTQEPVMVADAWGERAPSTLLIAAGDRGPTVYLEASQVAGMRRRRGTGPLPAPAGSYGIGELLRAALRLQPARIVVGIGELAILDGGLGMLRALAGRDADSAIDDVLSAARGVVGGVDLVAATADDPTLLGLKGASATAGELFGRDRVWSQTQERRMGDYAQRARHQVAERTDLLSGSVQRLDRLPGSGAGGGLGFGLALLGARLVNGPAFVADAVGLPAAARRADLAVTVTQTFDWRVLEHSVPQEVTRAVGAYGRPVVVIAREVEVGRRETMSFGVSGTYPLYRLGPRSGRLEDLDVVSALHDMARRVAATWTPPQGRDVP